MTKITKEEIKKLAEMTKLSLSDAELDEMRGRLEAVLVYAERVQEIAQDIEIPSIKNVNHDRQDIVDQKNSDVLLSMAPQHEDNYFVVPKIIDA